MIVNQITFRWFCIFDDATKFINWVLFRCWTLVLSLNSRNADVDSFMVHTFSTTFRYCSTALFLIPSSSSLDITSSNLSKYPLYAKTSSCDESMSKSISISTNFIVKNWLKGCILVISSMRCCFRVESRYLRVDSMKAMMVDSCMGWWRLVGPAVSSKYGINFELVTWSAKEGNSTNRWWR